MKIYLYPHNKNSQGAEALSEQLSAPRIKRENSRFKGGNDKVVVNWGNGGGLTEEIEKSRVLNQSEIVGRVTNKLKFFQEMERSGASCLPEWTTQKDVALGWFNNARCTVFARTILQGHSGEGIVELNKPEDFGKVRDGTLLVRYHPKKDEYRIHFSRIDGMFDVQRKARSLNVADPNWRIRNHKNGFVYARGKTSEVPKAVLEAASECFIASGLDFGGVDVIYNEKHNKAYVLEINTAPGLEGTTVIYYSNALKRLAESFFGKPKTTLASAVKPKFSYTTDTVTTANEILNEAALGAQEWRPAGPGEYFG